MIAPIHLFLAILCFLYLAYIPCLKNAFRHHWEINQSEQNRLNLVALLIACIFWPVIIPIAYLEVIQKEQHCLKAQDSTQHQEP